MRYAIVERFCRILATMMEAGVPLPEAMAVLGQRHEQRRLPRRLAEVREAMMRGEGLARPLGETDLFPPRGRPDVRVGENTGTLDEQLERRLRLLRAELDYKIERFTGAVRARRDHLHGLRRRLRRHRARLGDVRHLHQVQV